MSPSKSVLFLIGLVLWVFVYASPSNGKYIPYHSKFIKDYNKHKGNLQFYDGQTVIGIFAYDDFFRRTFISYSNSGKQINKYKYNDIKRMVLAGCDSTLSSKDSTYFIKLFDKKDFLYRQLTFGDIEIFDQYFNVNYTHGLIGNFLVIRYKNKLYTAGTRKKFSALIRNFVPEKFSYLSNKKFLDVITVVKKINSIK